MALNISEIKQVPLPIKCYNGDEHPKSMLFIHHTAGGSNPYNVIDGWKNRTDKVATAFVIGGKTSSSMYKDGEIIQAFASKHWAYHLGLKKDIFTSVGLPYKQIDSISIGIEICNWGHLTLGEDGEYRNYVNGVVPKDEVVEYPIPFRGQRFYHKYTTAQIKATEDLLIYLCDKYKIPKTYNKDIWDINKDALSGKAGIYTHVSVRKDKEDCHPQGDLIVMLKNLNQTQPIT